MRKGTLPKSKRCTQRGDLNSGRCHLFDEIWEWLKNQRWPFLIDDCDGRTESTVIYQVAEPPLRRSGNTSTSFATSGDGGNIFFRKASNYCSTWPWFTYGDWPAFNDEAYHSGMVNSSWYQRCRWGCRSLPHVETRPGCWRVQVKSLCVCSFFGLLSEKRPLGSKFDNFTRISTTLHPGNSFSNRKQVLVSWIIDRGVHSMKLGGRLESVRFPESANWLQYISGFEFACTSVAPHFCR